MTYILPEPIPAKPTNKELIKQLKKMKGDLYVAVVGDNDAPLIKVYKSSIIEYLLQGEPSDLAEWRLEIEPYGGYLSVY